MRAIDIMMLGTFSAWGRGTIQARSLPMARQLQRAGLRVCIITTPWDRPGDAETVDMVDGVHVINTPIRRGPVHPSIIMVGALRRYRPRAIHLVKPKGYSGLAALMHRRNGADQPLLIVDTDDWEGDGGWNDLGDYSAIQRRVFEWQERRLIQQADHVIAASTILERRAQLLKGDSAGDTVTYVPNALEEDWIRRLRSARDGVEQNRRIVLYSRFVEFPPGWIQQFIRNLADCVSADADVILVGAEGHPETAKGRLGDISVRYTGYVHRSEIPQLLGSASVAVYPYEDSLITRSKQSVKLLELMASGCAVVASDVGEIPTVLGSSGVRVPSCDPGAFAHATSRLLDNPKQAATLSRSAIERVEQRYCWSTMGSRLTDIYTHLEVSSGCVPRRQ